MSAARLALLSVAVAVGLGGCTLGPDYQRPELELATGWRTPAADAADLANTDWWRAFGDDRLERLIDQALDANRDLRIAALRIDEFSARLQVSRAGAAPTVGYGVDAARQRRSQERPNGLAPGASPTLSNFELGGSLSWELDFWGRIRRANEAALAELLAAEESRRAVMLTVVADVAEGYVALLELDRQLAIAEQKHALLREAVALMQAKVDGGSATRLDVENLRALAEEQGAALPALRREIAVAELKLSALLGREAGPIERRRLDDLALPQLPAGVPADILTRRPDVAAAEQALVAANARIGVAQAGYFPSLSLTAALGVGADDLRWLFAETARTGSIGAGLSGMLFDGGRVEGEVKQALARRDQAVEQFLKVLQTALLEVEGALSARAWAGEREQAIARRVRALEDVIGLSELRLAGGQIARLEVYDAELKLRDAQSAAAEGRRDTLLALVSVYRAMGGGWMREQERIRADTPVAAAAQTKTPEEATK